MSAILARDVVPEGRYIYNHDIMNCTAEGVVGNHLYSGRALGITAPWDMIQLHEDLKPFWNDICAHYERVGLTHTRDVIWSLGLKELGAHVTYKPSVFYYGPEENQFWGDSDWLNAVEYINSKNNFMALAKQLGVDVPVTLCFDAAGEIVQSDIKEVVYPCYLKAAVSVSGVGIFRCENEAKLLKNLKTFEADIPVQIQEEVIAETFLNMQYKVVGNELSQLEASEQILDGFVHQGNRVPAVFAPWAAVDPMAEWLVEKGMKGIFAFDVAVCRTQDGVRFPSIECNPRFNGASYPTLVAQKLNIDEWSAMTFDTSYRTLYELDLSDIEYNPGTGEGAVIINWGTISVGKLVILLAGSREYQETLALELDARL